MNASSSSLAAQFLTCSVWEVGDRASAPALFAGYESGEEGRDAREDPDRRTAGKRDYGQVRGLALAWHPRTVDPLVVWLLRKPDAPS